MSEPTAKPRRRWIMPVLVVSLALNMLIVGIVAGWTFSTGGKQPDRVSREVSNLVGPQFFRALEQSDRRALVRDIVRQRDRVRENRTALKDRIARLLVELEAETLDTEAVRALLEEQRTSVARRHQFGEELLLTRLSEMSATERQAFAARLAESLKRVRRD